MSNLLINIGSNIDIAIKRRSLRRVDIAEMAGVSLPTLRDIINGKGGVSIEKYVFVLEALGLQEGLEKIAAPELDAVGQAFSIDALPKRAQRKKGKW